MQEKPGFNLANVKIVLEPDQPPPGRWVISERNPSLRQWQGERFWVTRHGPAFCSWRQGEPNSAHNVLMPNGIRGYADYTIFAPFRGWRRPEKETAISIDGWIFGRVEISDADILFIDAAEQPVVEPPVDWGYPDLECDMWKSAYIKERSQEQGFAMALFMALEYQTWQYKYGGIWHCTIRGAGSVTSGLRGRGENFHDYYDRGIRELAHGHEQEVENALGQIAWYPMPDNKFHTIEGIAHQKLAEWEVRPQTLRPTWYGIDILPRNHVQTTRLGALLSRVHQLAETGKSDQAEYQEIMQLLRPTA